MAAVTLSAGALGVGFEHCGDRVAHWIEAAGPSSDGAVQRWLESIEGTPSQLWPASPALQSLHVEEREGRVSVALLVGMAGGSHWSMSVEADASRGELTFDVACRTRDVPEFLGSSYRLAAAGAERFELVIDDAAGLAEAQWHADRRLTITPNVVPEAGPRTYRWRYHLRPGELVA